MIRFLKDYLVILAGSPRGGESTWSSLYKYVVNHLDADLAICCSDQWEQNSSLFKKAKDKGWYSGPSFIVEDLLYDYCLNKTTQRSWSNYCGADIIPSQEEQLSPK